MSAVLRSSTINDFVSRHRRAAALAGVIVILGVVALDAHAMLHENHVQQNGKVTMCVAALAIATLAALGWWCKKRSPGAATHMVAALLPQHSQSLPASPPRASARAGPGSPAVLRL